MSENVRTRRDAGMTLPEVLIAVLVSGLLVAALATATTVMLRQTDNSKGRLNNARSEQNVGIWMPSDLASAEEVTTDPGASPCGTECPPSVNVGGSNALMLSWTGTIAGATEAIPTRTTVSYRYVQVGDEYQIIRVACFSINSAPPTCDQVVMLRNVDPPPPGQEFIPGVTSPEWVMLVTLAVDPAAPDDGTGPVPLDPTYYVKNGRRVTVTINGGGDISGSGGGRDQITLSAGGVNRDTNLSTTNLSANPTFSATRSRCGGNFGLIVDTSGSIGSTNMTSVRNGITGFINAFAGTPVKLQIVRFSTTATTLGSGAGWSRYFDMLVESDVNELKTLVTGLSSTGGTNYEDAFFRMFRNSDGTVQQVLPSRLIFFTDGIPTYSRLNSTSASAAVTAHPGDSGLPAANGSSYSQQAWNRANRILRQFEVDMEKVIGVYVGSDVNGTSTWQTQGAGYHLTDFVRGYNLTWDRGYHQTWEYAASGITYQRAGSGLTYQYANSGLTWERLSGGVWSSISRSTYNSNNVNNTESDGYRVRVTGSLGSWQTETQTNYERSNTIAGQTDGYRTTASSPSSWTSTTKALYDLSNTVAGQSDGFRTTTGTLGNWTATTEAYYLLNNTTGDATDGFRISQNFAAPYSLWTSTTQALYNANNTTADESDGWRQNTNYSSPYSLWEPVTEALYNANNTSWGTTDGWSATKVYAEPYTAHENPVSITRQNRDILKELIAPSGPVPAIPAGGPYTNADQATYYELPNWNQFAGAMTTLALAECGGTVTLQTKVGASAAADPFTYQSSVDLTTATTSAQFRSGTFDYDLSGGGSVTVDISPLNTSNLSRYSPVGWSCKAGGVDYPFVATPIDGGPWTKITLTVSPNNAISCVNQVAVT